MSYNKNAWFAVMRDRSDDDWGVGSFDQTEAERMVCANLDLYPDGYIAVIDGGTCVDEIAQADFSPVYAAAAEIVKAHDWDACQDALNNLMYRLDMTEEWAGANDAEAVIRAAGKKIGVDLV